MNKEPLPGFQNLGVDILIKLGGSLLSDLEKCKLLALELSDLGGYYNIVVFPGGGPIDNYIEKLDKSISFQPEIHHNLCARAQDQTGLIFGSMCNNAEFFSTFVVMKKIFDENKLAIMLPMNMIVNLNVFEQSWKVTSDTMAAYFANILSADKFAILTNVNGIYKKPDMSGNICNTINASILNDKPATCVDACLPSFLLEKNQTCHILNGYDVESIRDWIENKTNKGTVIYPR